MTWGQLRFHCRRMMQRGRFEGLQQVRQMRGKRILSEQTTTIASVACQDEVVRRATVGCLLRFPRIVNFNIAQKNTQPKTHELRVAFLIVCRLMLTCSIREPYEFGPMVPIHEPTTRPMLPVWPAR